MKKIILVSTFSGRRIYIRATEEKWKELTKDVEVLDKHVSGWKLNQDKMVDIVCGSYPEREDYPIVAILPWRDYYADMGLTFVAEPPAPEYFINYSLFDKPERQS